MVATAERFGQRPSDLLALPPDEGWLRYCVDEALHVLDSGHQARDIKWDDRHRKEDDSDADGEYDLYNKFEKDKRFGKPPADFDRLPGYSAN